MQECRRPPHSLDILTHNYVLIRFRGHSLSPLSIVIELNPKSKFRTSDRKPAPIIIIDRASATTLNRISVSRSILIIIIENEAMRPKARNFDHQAIPGTIFKGEWTTLLSQWFFKLIVSLLWPLISQCSSCVYAWSLR